MNTVKCAEIIMNTVKCAECNNEIIYSDYDVLGVPAVENGIEIEIEIDVVICDFCGCEQSV